MINSIRITALFELLELLYMKNKMNKPFILGHCGTITTRILFIASFVTLIQTIILALLGVKIGIRKKN
jgi:hypothetical protein